MFGAYVSKSTKIGIFKKKTQNIKRIKTTVLPEPIVL